MNALIAKSRIAAVFLGALAILATGSCNPFAAKRDPELQLFLDINDSPTRFPPAENGSVKPVTGLDDPKGYAGLEIVLAGDIERRVFTAGDFAGIDDGTLPAFRVPETGIATVTVRLVEDGRIVAEGSEQWHLESEVYWDFFIARGPYPATEGFHGVDEFESPRCHWFWCWHNWRFPIAEDAANYEHEALWVTLYREHPDECQDVCAW